MMCLIYILLITLCFIILSGSRSSPGNQATSAAETSLGTLPADLPAGQAAAPAGMQHTAPCCRTTCYVTHTSTKTTHFLVPLISC